MHLVRDRPSFILWDLQKSVVILRLAYVIDACVGPGRFIYTANTRREIQAWSISTGERKGIYTMPWTGNLCASNEILLTLFRSPYADLLSHFNRPQVYGVDTYAGARIWLRNTSSMTYLEHMECSLPMDARLACIAPNESFVVHASPDRVALSKLRDSGPDYSRLLVDLQSTNIVRPRWPQELQVKIAISPDGTSIAMLVGHYCIYRVWITREASVGNDEPDIEVDLVSQIYPSFPLENRDGMSCLVYSPDNRYLAIVSLMGTIVVLQNKMHAG